MTDIVKRNENLPADFVSRLMSGIAESRASTIVAGGKPFFRLSRSGTYVFGQNNEEVQEGSEWAVNVMTLSHGWSCWVDGGPGHANELAGEVMVPMTSPKPVRPEPIDDTPFKEQRSLDLKCISGDDTGTEVVYKINSVGGMRAVDGLLAAIYEQLARNPAYPCPVIVFDSTSYSHKKWGEIFVPIFNIAGWADMNGNREDEDPAPRLPLNSPATNAAPARKRKAPVGAAAAPAATEKPVEPIPTAQAYAGQRRRPVAS